MIHDLRMLALIASDSKGVDENSTMPFACQLDVTIIVNQVNFLRGLGFKNFAFVRGAKFTINRFTSADDAISFAKKELIKEVR